MATTFPSQRYQASWGTVGRFAVLLIVLCLSFPAPTVSFAQGDAAESESAVSNSSGGGDLPGGDGTPGPTRTFTGIASGFGSKVRGIFGSKDSATEETPKKSNDTTARRESGPFKPGAIRNGFSKQIRATTESEDEADVAIDEPSKTNGSSAEEKTSTAPKATNRVAKRPYLEPFTKPMPPNVASNTSTNASQPTATRTRAEQGPSLDPPSLVGTGIRASRESAATSTTSTGGASQVNRFKQPSGNPSSLPKTSAQAQPDSMNIAPRSLPEVVSSSQVAKSFAPTATREVERSNTGLVIDPLNSRVKDPSATTRKSANTVALDPREEIRSATTTTTRTSTRDLSSSSAAGDNLLADSTAEEGMRPVAKKSVPSSTRRESTTAMSSTPPTATTNLDSRVPQSSSSQAPTSNATGQKSTASNGLSYDSPNTSYPLTSNQYSGPQTPSKQAIGGGLSSNASNNQLPNQASQNNRVASLNSNASSGGTPPTNSAQPSLSNSIGSARIDMSIPKVRLMVVGPTALQVAKAVPYEVVIKNEGAEQLSGVIVGMTVPAGVTPSSFVSTAGEFETEKDDQGMETVLWHVTDLGPSESRIFRLNLEASKPEHFAMDVEWTVLPQAGQVQIAVEQPQLTLALEGPSEVLWGKPELYRLKVRNPGNSPAKDVQVKLVAEAFGSNESSIGDILPGGERIVEVELTFQQTGSIAISGQAVSKLQSLEANSKIDVAVNQIKLESEWKAPARQYLGSVEEYQVTLHNRSTMAGENVMCSAVIPEGLSIDQLPEGASIVGKEIRWKVATIQPLESKDFKFSFQATEAADAKLRFEAKSAGNGTTLAEAIAVLDPIVDLKLTVIDPVAPAPVGQDVQYDMVILNRGTRSARAVKVVAQFSNGIEPIRAEGVMGKLVPGQVIFDSIDTIGPGQQITLRVVAQAAEAGVHRFRAELQCEDGETQLIEEESTRYLATSRSDSTKPTVRR